jgi:hypothetical protein
VGNGAFAVAHASSFSLLLILLALRFDVGNQAA